MNLTDFIIGATILAWLAVAVVFIAWRRSRDRRHEIDQAAAQRAEAAAAERKEAWRVMIRARAGMGAGHPETPGPSLEPDPDAARYLAWLEDAPAVEVQP